MPILPTPPAPVVVARPAAEGEGPSELHALSVNGDPVLARQARARQEIVKPKDLIWEPPLDSSAPRL